MASHVLPSITTILHLPMLLVSTFSINTKPLLINKTHNVVISVFPFLMAYLSRFGQLIPMIELVLQMIRLACCTIRLVRVASSSKVKGV
ncbi:hypothetical protein BDF20DRAFT_341765 [Mycotypha africana]|uniref:uncharacterized protein n=1 Tax=Mycotypha africana TaxID=64632 RepID=UPI0023012B9C|nr:uncharacterized protein BDF20DRAFT_341765 [Mycotypha africana]KAI8988609.1 hypothetical protein BDF20DRAFT_341765 [Mycotypha africana]